LATHRLADAFGLANYRFDSEQNRVVSAEGSAGSHNGQSNPTGVEPATTFLVLRGGKVYFEGGQQEMRESRDEYLQRCLGEARA
jgi:hypothetical protein